MWACVGMCGDSIIRAYICAITFMTARTGKCRLLSHSPALHRVFIVAGSLSANNTAAAAVAFLCSLVEAAGKHLTKNSVAPAAAFPLLAPGLPPILALSW